jgi:hypothetical protein
MPSLIPVMEIWQKRYLQDRFLPKKTVMNKNNRRAGRRIGGRAASFPGPYDNLFLKSS